MSEPHAPEEFSDWNEQMIQRYDPEVFHHHPSGVVRWVENQRVAAVIRMLGARAEHRILDAGCGAGNILARLPGEQRHGIDLSNFMVQRAQEQLNGAAQIVCGDAERLPYEDASFDRVVASSLLSHALHPEQIIAEIRRVTKPGGRVVISVSNEEQIEKGMRWVRALGLGRFFMGKDQQPQVYNVEYHLHRFSLARLRELAGGNLREMSVSRIPFVFPVHAVVLYER